MDIHFACTYKSTDACFSCADCSRSLIAVSEPFSGTLHGHVLIRMHVQYVHTVLGNKCVTVDDTSHFSRQREEGNASSLIIVVPCEGSRGKVGDIRGTKS